MKKFFSVLLAALMLFTVAGCGASEPAPAPAESAQEAAPAEPAPAPESEPAEEPAASGEPVTILVAAAASLEYSYKDKLIPMFTEKYPWITVEGTYDSSGKLQTQIEEGLEADVFMSAATKQMNALKDESLVDADSIVDLLENKIVLIAPAGSEPAAKSFETVTDAATIAVGDPESVPVGQYSKEAFTNLGNWDAVSAKASLGTNVTEVLNWVAEGSADVGVVYATDAATTDKVQVVAEAPGGQPGKEGRLPGRHRVRLAAQGRRAALRRVPSERRGAGRL